MAALAGFLLTGCSSGAHRPEPSATFQIRLVSCTATPYEAHTKATPLTCGPGFRLTAANLNIQPSASAAGFSSRPIPPCPCLAGDPSTNSTNPPPGKIELLSGTSAGQRYLVFPAFPGLSTRSIASASAARASDGEWVVDLSLTRAGATAWDEASREAFHEMVAIAVNGRVVSAPLVLPQQEAWTSFDGQIELGGLSKGEAQRLAAEL